MSWVLRAGGQRTYERRLGHIEHSFYWDSVFNGTADTFQFATVRTKEAEGRDLFAEGNVSRTWTILKQMFPLLGSRLEEQDEAKEVLFVVDVDRLRHSGPEEIGFQRVASFEEVEEFGWSAVTGKRLLSNDQLARLFVFHRTDDPNTFHVVIHAAHCITDGIANLALLRTFLDTLATPDFAQDVDLDKRLALAVASDDLYPALSLSVPIQRWRRAVSSIILGSRMEKLTGGHTLPRKFSNATPTTPAQSGRIACVFTPEKSAAIIQRCRQMKVTFGNAYPVLAQAATTRVLCRRFLRGEISKEEWDFRRKEPMTTGGPLNLRPYLDRQWFEQGGSSNLCVSIGFFFHTLPFMPLGSASKLTSGDAMPSYAELLSPQRFLLRCSMVKKQAVALIKHPLFLDMLAVRGPLRLERIRKTAQEWRAGKVQANDNRLLSPIEQAQNHGPIMSHGGSSFGNIDSLVPLDYPLSSKTPGRALLHLEASGTLLHCRPAELYLGAATSRHQLRLHVSWDKNVFEEDIVREWLEEVQGATDFYLGHSDGPMAHL